MHGTEKNPLVDAEQGVFTPHLTNPYEADAGVAPVECPHLGLLATSPGNWWLEADYRAERVYLEGKPKLSGTLVKLSSHYCNAAVKNIRTSHPPGKPVQQEEFDRAASLFKELMKGVLKYANDRADDTSEVLSLQQGLDHVFASLPSLANISSRLRMLVDWNLLKQEMWHAGAAVDLNLAAFEEDDNWGDYPGPHCLVMDKGGVSRVITALQAQLTSATTLLLNHKVTTVDASATANKGSDDENESPVTVSTANGTSFTGKRVLVTFPIGVLQASPRMFVPPLSASKQNAFAALKMGSYLKIYLLFEEPFWTEPNGGMETEKPEPRLFQPFLGLAGHPERVSCFVDYHAVKRVPVLIGVAANELGRKLSKLSDEALVEECLGSLSLMLSCPLSALPAPTAVNVKRWDSDEFSMGAYSYLALGATEQDCEAMSEPELDGRVFFAGEGCSLEGQGCMHGAVDTAVEAVKVMVKSLGGD